MTWYLSAIIAVLTFSIQFSLFQRLQKTYSIQVYLFYAWMIPSISLGILSLPAHGIPLSWVTIIPLVLAGVASYIGNGSYNLSISRQPNLGYVESLSSIRIALTYIFSLFYLSSEFNWIRLVALVGVTLGVVIVAGRKTSASNASVQSGWATSGIIAGVMFAVLAVTSRFAFANGVDSIAGTSVILLIAGLLYGGEAIVRKRELKPSKDVLILILVGILGTVGNAALFDSYSRAPNLAYTTAISSSRMILLYLLSLAKGSDKLDLIRATGIVVTFISVIFLG